MGAGLERIRVAETLDYMGSEYIPMGNFNPEKWFSDMIGVTKDRTMKPQKVVFRASPKEAPYIRTKPLHRSQMVI